MPEGVATLKKTRVFNANDYRNGGQIPIEFECSVDESKNSRAKQKRRSQVVSCSDEDDVDDQPSARKMHEPIK